MLSKLRGQLEEMKAKVQFLSLVKKYLQARPFPCAAHGTQVPSRGTEAG